MAGCSAILRASQGTRFVDPTAPYLHEAAFWIYVRQSLYDATIHQRPLDIDFSLELRPAPESIPQTHPWSWLGSETAWANQILWNTASVAQFCFSGNRAQNDAAWDTQWRALWDKTQKWLKDRPNTFDPMGSSPPLDEGTFPCIWFSSDWHGKSKYHPLRFPFFSRLTLAYSNLLYILPLFMYLASQLPTGPQIRNSPRAQHTIRYRGAFPDPKPVSFFFNLADTSPSTSAKFSTTPEPSAAHAKPRQRTRS